MSQFTQVEAAGYSMQVDAAHRQFNPTPVAFHATFTVPLSLDDLVAVLWVICPGPDELAEYEDDEEIRTVVMDAIINGSASDIEEAHLDIAAVKPRSVAGRHLAQLRATITRAFTPAAVTTPAPRALTMAGV